MERPEAATISVRVAYSPRAGEVDEVELRLPAGATIELALRESGLRERHAGIVLAGVGVWGKARALGDVLRDADRVEVYRPLTVDPKEARRQRYKAHLAKYGRK